MKFGKLESHKVPPICLDYLEILCQTNTMIIGCGEGDHQVWVSPFGPHSDALSREEVDQVLTNSPAFEVIQIIRDLELQYCWSRQELELQLRRLVN